MNFADDWGVREWVLWLAGSVVVGVICGLWVEFWKRR